MGLLDGLKVYLKFDEAASTDDAADAHNVGPYNATQVNSPGTTTGKLNGGRTLAKANSQYFSIADNADISCGDVDWSAQIWVLFTAFDPIVDAIAGKWTAGTDGEWLLYLLNGVLKFAVSHDGTNTTTVNGPTLSTSQWYCIHCWHDATANEIGLSVDAGTAYTEAKSNGTHSGAEPLLIGRNSNINNQDLNGTVDEFAFWRTHALTGSERTTLYNSGTPLPYSSFGAAAVAGPILFGRVVSPGRIFGGSALAC